MQPSFKSITAMQTSDYMFFSPRFCSSCCKWMKIDALLFEFFTWFVGRLQLQFGKYHTAWKQWELLNALWKGTRCRARHIENGTAFNIGLEEPSLICWELIAPLRKKIFFWGGGVILAMLKKKSVKNVATLPQSTPFNRWGIDGWLILSKSVLCFASQWHFLHTQNCSSSPRGNVISKPGAWQQSWKGCIWGDVTVMDTSALRCLLMWVMVDQEQFVHWFTFCFCYLFSKSHFFW